MMTPEGLAEIKQWAATLAAGKVRRNVNRLIEATEAVITAQWPPPAGAEIDPGELFRRGHVLLQATSDFQAFSAVALLESYADTFAHSPNAAELVKRIEAEIARGQAAAELIASKHESDQTPAERRVMIARRRLRKILELAAAAAAYSKLGRELKETPTP